MVLQGLAPKSESIKIFDKLKTKPANKVPSFSRGFTFAQD
jgi:hypothetical protein